ncbi:hypothetical protein K469DRAFT_712491 [Zopfia rhizophila CBS 207.26]|uniref:CENP-V/GFA domain-containing protein n=1 Tax=Zopfia rhizophila CBS 207.26 TaxID=1314779 RepID=A0A6A6ESF1_9PEZI|nr:hypothetical protein K469DRAFT_712491 [Zopfia rhizophila CBS 207.26]
MPEGGCICGNVRYNIEGEPVMKALCHCLDCRKISGSTYSTNAIYQKDNFKLLKGSPKTHVKTADGGNPITSYFCGDCGSTMWRDGDSFPGMNVIKVGTIDDTDAISKAKPGVELYVSRRVDWVPATEGTEQKAMS